MFWILMFGSFALISVMVVNPIPIVAVAVAWLVAQPFERPLRNEIIAAGGNPEAPPSPTSPTGCLAFILYVLVMGAAILLFIGIVGVAITEGGG
jgi:hypothetical protein